MSCQIYLMAYEFKLVLGILYVRTKSLQINHSFLYGSCHSSLVAQVKNDCMGSRVLWYLKRS